MLILPVGYENRACDPAFFRIPISKTGTGDPALGITVGHMIPPQSVSPCDSAVCAIPLPYPAFLKRA